VIKGKIMMVGKLKIVYCLFLLILAVIWAIRCDYDKVSDDTGVVIYGTISDSATGLPLEAWGGLGRF